MGTFSFGPVFLTSPDSHASPSFLPLPFFFLTFPGACCAHDRTFPRRARKCSRTGNRGRKKSSPFDPLLHTMDFYFQGNLQCVSKYKAIDLERVHTSGCASLSPFSLSDKWLEVRKV